MNAQPHTIRLNGPWEMIAGLAEEADRVKLPQGWPQVIEAAQAGPVILQRWFHRPTGIDDGAVVQLQIEGIPLRGSVSINDASLGSFAEFSELALNIHAHLLPRSCLTISIDQPIGQLDTTTTPQVSLVILPAR
ncbi:hypothetical protein GC197_07300 [bacterium]|nr:hypothetical protein [bacterium]